GELDAFRCLQRGEAAASAMLDLNWNAWTRDGTIDSRQFGVIARTRIFDHCVFTTRDDLDRDSEQRWLTALFAMRYDDPAHREMMDREGLRAWMPGGPTGFGALADAVASEQFFASPPQTV